MAPDYRGYPTPKHVWVTTGSGRFPGLLLEWVRAGDKWKGRVIWAEPYVVQQAVLAAKQLEPISRRPHLD
jgi:hypothetical protein